MKYFTILLSSMFAFSMAFCEVNIGPYQDLEAAHHHKNSSTTSSHHKEEVEAFGSFITKTTQILGHGGTSDIAFETTLDSKNITKEPNNTTFVILESGKYNIHYGVAIANVEIDGPHLGIFSIHKNGTKVSGTELGINSFESLTSYAVILRLEQGDIITLSLDTATTPGFGAVLVEGLQGNGVVANSNGAYINFNKIN